MNTKDALEAIGLSRDELEGKVVAAITEGLLSEWASDEDGEGRTNTPLANKLRKLITEQIDKKLASLAQKHVLPGIGKLVEKMLLTPTNTYGEPKGPPETLAEYMTRRAEDFLKESVDCNGRKDSYSSSFNQPRIMWLVDKYLQNSIQTAVANSLQSANTTLGEQITKAVVSACDKAIKGLRVEAKIPRP